MLVSRVNTPSDVQRPHRQKRLVLSCLECHKRKQKCDRQQPCYHCARRGKPEICLYEYTMHVCSSNGTFPTNSTSVAVLPTNSASQSQTGTTPGSEYTNNASLVLSRQMGYSRRSHTGTLGMLAQLGELDDIAPERTESQRKNDAANQYFNLIRQIPARRQVNILVDSFFAHVAWQYDIIDEATFRNELSIWNQVSYTALKEGPEFLPINTRFFPTLLLQILALALLYQPVQTDEALDDLKYAPNIEFADLAADYSSAGDQIMTTLGGQDVSMIRVQARLMEACFKKSIGSVIEAWHILGRAIRDAQELGLHGREIWGTDTPTAQLATQPLDLELGRRLWFVLHLWDAHMANVLGRPMATKLDPSIVTSKKIMAGSPQLDGSTLVPMEAIFYGYHTAYKYLQDIHNLDVTADNAQETAQMIHNAVVRSITQLPAWLTSPSLAMDGRYPWLPAARETLITEVYFVLLALHRPFSNSVSRSRKEGLMAALQILEAQSRLFDQTGPESHMNFTLIFSTFDAMVFVAATYIHFPSENSDLLPASLTCMEWGLARLNAMSARNVMATFAFDVVGVLSQKMSRRVSTPPGALGLDGNELGDVHTSIQTAPCEGYAWPEALNPELGPDSSLLQQPLYDMVCRDLFGESYIPEFADTTASGPEQRDDTCNDRFWQLMDDLT